MRNLLAGAAIALMATTAFAAEPKSGESRSSKTSGDVKKLGSTSGEEASGKKSEKSEVSQKDLTAIKDVANKLAKAFNDNDAQAAADLFAQDATLIDPYGKEASGRDEIRKLIDENLSTMKGTTSFTDIQVKMVKPDVAFLDMEHQLSGAKAEGTEAKEGAPQRIHVSGLMVKQGGKWQIKEARPATVAEEPTTSS